MKSDSSTNIERILELPVSRIVLTRDHLVRLSSEEAPIASLELSNIRKMRVRRSISWTTLLLTGITAGIGIIPRLCGAYFPWTLITELPFGALVLVLLLSGGIETELVVYSDSGKVVFPVTDVPADATAFVVSAAEHMAKR